LQINININVWQNWVFGEVCVVRKRMLWVYDDSCM
jgi:hypothetical protein